ncbi:MAG: hypothetical protein ACRDWI_04425 [Jiangellaceae bacterium]
MWGDQEHGIYFGEFDILLEPQDDQLGIVVGELRLNGDGWFNYFGFPEQPFGTPFTFSHSGRDVKALTYGNLGTGGLSKATFEQFFVGHPSGTFVPGYGTHSVEHRAIDAAGNIGDAPEFDASVLPGQSPGCTQTVTGKHNGKLTVKSGVTCLDGARVNGAVIVRPGASLVATESSINGGLSATGAVAVQLFGTVVNGSTEISGTTMDVTTSGNRFNGKLALSGNTQVSANSQFGEYGPILAGNRVNGGLACSGNSSAPGDFGAQNTVNGTKAGQCAGL